ncbi:hypothetical protein B0H17DRAFT_1127081 [Mycena rosella]|uniref:Uncharacterized protein n=1 Tax=Mycena rosella TaxID=1033263 RepID=A0AAD7M6Y0_MYCRO|nr:hypothetical protein B0H17DRAFT_1127081 [Mycena rosella]
MCARDTLSALRTSVLFAALAMVPGNTSRFNNLSLASMSLMIDLARHYGPTQRLAWLKDTLATTEEILEGAKLDCAAKSASRFLMKFWVKSWNDMGLGLSEAVAEPLGKDDILQQLC